MPTREIFQVLEMYNMLLEISSELDSIKAMLEKSKLYIFHHLTTTLSLCRQKIKFALVVVCVGGIFGLPITI